eukprot:418638-Prymnesium_polylepis.2
MCIRDSQIGRPRCLPNPMFTTQPKSGARGARPTQCCTTQPNCEMSRRSGGGRFLCNRRLIL